MGETVFRTALAHDLNNENPYQGYLLELGPLAVPVVPELIAELKRLKPKRTSEIAEAQKPARFCLLPIWVAGWPCLCEIARILDAIGPPAKSAITLLRRPWSDDPSDDVRTAAKDAIAAIEKSAK